MAATRIYAPDIHTDHRSFTAIFAFTVNKVINLASDNECESHWGGGGTRGQNMTPGGKSYKAMLR